MSYASTFAAKDFRRPNFQNTVYVNAVQTHNIFNDADIDPSDAGLRDRNAAVPHRMSWKDIRENTLKFMNNAEDYNAFLKWTERIKAAAVVTRGIIVKSKKKYEQEYNSAKGDELGRLEDLIGWCDGILKRIDDCIKKFDEQRHFLGEVVNTYYEKNSLHKMTRDVLLDAGKNFLCVANIFYAIVPDIGPHRGTNIQVSNRVHLHVNNDGSLSPMSDRVVDMTPGRTSGVATTPKRGDVVTTEGTYYPIANFSPNTQTRIANHGTVPVNARPPVWKPY